MMAGTRRQETRMLLDRVPREELPESLVPIYEMSAQRTGRLSW